MLMDMTPSQEMVAEEVVITKLRDCFKVWKVCMSQVLNEKCMDSVSKQTQLNVSTNAPQLTSSPKNGRKLESIVRYSLYFVYNIIIFEVFNCKSQTSDKFSDCTAS